jgi:hypothetical protein
MPTAPSSLIYFCINSIIIFETGTRSLASTLPLCRNAQQSIRATVPD